MRALPPLPSLQSLRVLDAVVQRQNYSAAAHDLGLTHAAVSRQIRRLENHAGVVLFERRGGRMAPTDAALAISARAGYALRSLADILGRPAARSSPARLHLATTAPFARFWLAPRLLKLFDLDGVQLATVDVGPTLAPFKAGKVDVAIRYGRGEWPGVQARLLGLERTFAVASPAFAKRMRKRDPLSIVSAPLIANDFVSWRSWLSAAGLPSGAPLNVVIETKDTNFAIDAALSGAGVALARLRLVGPLIASGELVALSSASFDDGYSYYLAWPSDSRRKAAIGVLGDWLEAEFERESGELQAPMRQGQSPSAADPM